MHSHTLRAAALMAAALAALSACDQLPSNPHNAFDASLSPVSRTTAATAPISDAVREDAAAYAAEYGVGVDEAMRRLRLQSAAGELNARLQAAHPETFAGLTIEHQPEFRVVARFTRNGAEALGSAIADPALARVTVAERAAVPLAQLRRRVEAAYGRVHGRGIEAAAAVNVRGNRPEVHVLAGSAAAARAALGSEAAVVVVDRLPEREVLMYGGLPGSACTLGFSVQNGSGTHGVTTAGHCGNSQSYSGYSLSFQAEAEYGSYDIQWHTRSGDTFDPIIKVGSGTRVITGTRTVSNQASGQWVCKQGITTGYTCGTISNTTYCWSGACTWVYVSGGSTNLSEPGDSGGPWFSGYTAYGTHVFGSGNNSGYMPIDYLSVLGLTVRTGPPPLSAELYGYDNIRYTGTHTFEAMPAGGNGTYTYYWTLQRPDQSVVHGTGKTFSIYFPTCEGPEGYNLDVAVTSGAETVYAGTTLNVEIYSC